jgi:2-succinyl-5-enolpyruvyl-6-hydroxy-3-cyclohexene-1-carboxylate synthase
VSAPAPENATYACVGALVDELVRGGVDHLCLCPGSRSAPLAICAARQPGLRVWALVDERSAGFFAVGMARASGRPVALVSTSGTAAANFLPAVIEARHSRVPLVVVTADRPRELRDVAAPQTIDQVRLYGGYVKWFVDAAPPEPAEAMLRYFRTVASRAAATARERPAGPVHLNVPLREPLVPAVRPEIPPPSDRAPSAWDGRPSGRPYTTATQAARPVGRRLAARLAQELRAAPRGVIVAGPQDDARFPDAVAGLAAATGYPILADPLSQVRCGPHDRRSIIDSYDAFLRVGDLSDALAPEVIVRLGGVPVSRPLLGYIERHPEARHIVADAEDGWTDPLHLASDVLHAAPRRVCEAIAACMDAAGMRPQATWAARWGRLAEAARDAIREHLAGIDEPFEGKVFAELAGLVPDGATLYVGNSMPVRDLDTFFAGSARSIRVLGNRGASGIDGLVSSALGAAAVSGGPTILVLGDLAMYHDLNGLLAAKLHRLRTTIVLLNNDGGGIFSFLPQADYPEHFERLFGTPTGLDFRAAADLYGAAFGRAATWPDFRMGVAAGLASAGLSIVEVRTARDRNVALHRGVWAAVERAVSAARPKAPADAG